jgi:hypothetical protein
MSWLSAFGIVLDIVGAAWIAKALAFSSGDDFMEQAATRWDLSVSILRSLEHQRLDSRCGLVVLATGFLMQLVGMVFPDCPAWAAGVLATIVVFAALGYWHRTKAAEDGSREARVSKYIGRKD